MKSPKKRDLAKDLVDFLLTEEDQGKAVPKKDASEDSSEMPTAQISLEPPEFDLNLGDEKVPEVNFVNPTSKAQELTKPLPAKNFKLKPAKPEPAKQEPSEEPTYDVSKESARDRNQTVKIESSVEKVVPFKNGPQAIPTSGRGKQILNEVNALAGSVEAIRVAQGRIVAVEKEKDYFRNESEKLLVASEKYQHHVFELKAKLETLERKHKEKVEILEEEKLVLKTRLAVRETELGQLKSDHVDFQSRFQNEVRKVRVRERELENRYELLKAEESALLQTKDETILQLKRQLEQLHFEIENFRVKSADLNTKINDFHDRNHKTVKALRLALNILEIGDGDDPKKATG